MEIDQISGSITPGKKADFIITKPMNSLAQIAYSFGESPVASVFVNGIKIN
jgi:imidazolonepropionase